MGTISLPEYRAMTGRVTSMEVAPAAEIGANGPKYFRISGLPNNANISLKMLASKESFPTRQQVASRQTAF